MAATDQTPENHETLAMQEPSIHGPRDNGDGVTMAHPVEQLRPIRPARPEHEHRAGERILVQFVLHQRRQSIMAFAERAIVVPLVQARWRAIGLVATMIRTRFDGKTTTSPAALLPVQQSGTAASPRLTER